MSEKLSSVFAPLAECSSKFTHLFALVSVCLENQKQLISIPRPLRSLAGSPPNSATVSALNNNNSNNTNDDLMI